MPDWPLVVSKVEVWRAAVIHSLVEACHCVLVEQGEPQSSFWLASLLDECRLWRASEDQVRRALLRDIKRFGERSRFVLVSEDEFSLREWTSCRHR